MSSVQREEISLDLVGLLSTFGKNKTDLAQRGPRIDYLIFYPAAPISLVFILFFVVLIESVVERL